MADRNEMLFDVETMTLVSPCCEAALECAGQDEFRCTKCGTSHTLESTTPDADAEYVDYWLRYAEAENNR